MKAFIWKCVLICLGILFAIHFICIVTNDTNEFFTEYTDIEIIKDVPKQYVEWKGTNVSNGKVETFTAEYCKKCGNHLGNVEYEIKDLKSGKITLGRLFPIIAYTLLWMFFLFIIPIVDANTDSLEREEKITVVKHLMIFLGYNKDKLDDAIKEFNSYDLKRCRNIYGYDLSYSLFETFKRIKTEYNTIVTVNKDINIKEDYYKLIGNNKI
jgi:hypothetical protein